MRYFQRTGPSCGIGPDFDSLRYVTEGEILDFDETDPDDEPETLKAIVGYTHGWREVDLFGRPLRAEPPMADDLTVHSA